ncbi:MAG: M20 family metallopeptidase [Anaerovoracaceae bacterium]
MERIRREIEKIDIASLIADMIKIPSYSFMEEQEKEIAFYIKDFFDKEGIPCTVTEIAEGRYNVSAVLKGSGGGKSLMLTGHMDTVPAYDMEEPFSGRIEDGRIFGRGACDMKGPLASMMAAMAAFKRSGVQLRGDLHFVGVADEEEKESERHT